MSSVGFSDRHTASFTFTPTSTDETLSFSAIGRATEALPPFTLLDSVSATHETTIPALSRRAMMALGFAGRGDAGFRSNGRKPVWIDEAKA